jgi:hypothetical protein
MHDIINKVLRHEGLSMWTVVGMYQQDLFIKNRKKEVSCKVLNALEARSELKVLKRAETSVRTGQSG